MTVKSKRGRRRYIVFEVGTEVDKTLLTRATFRPGHHIKVISCDGGFAVVRCSPADTCWVSEAVASSFPGSEPLRTSGTLKSLRDRYSSLKKERRPPRNADKGLH
ncbi:MAG: hypothetical protein PHV81_00415 [Candidatus Methanomethylophilaceae archaeon]|jgi:RNase P/RNase MRP subunit POP5|nr:hypothetical protein [Candidatus Methanomethylophilaceae archaeon]NCA73302.1 hypothetical protein [Gammaproteobacteria bacterium]MDD2936340.1 hypothetical protein [Candidatus Methanomethylophilaceae archaeon]MDD3350952.1 hypothetical protein [Candidatus Methanomethylophilaceae archaeon]MDD3986560.1 hypothetical protein [Candidatus Methanomethylophilaceae archaeon]